ncbi:GroES-like protein [Mycena sanguinolenta]|uniref:GroES-like protein n=1 Tax=Mycena sanguinolenta TaxID=230812 RepID=A0A8H6TZC3_9AGAR|nr:GroES-like protein [Mycena sanguinolenta]
MQAVSNKLAEVRTHQYKNLLPPESHGRLIFSVSETLPPSLARIINHEQTGSTMKALAWFGARDVRLIDAPIPDITEPDDVILKVTGTTICGSDLHLSVPRRNNSTTRGDILGHEFMGIVDRVGPNVHNVHIGQRVVASFQIACGECSYCKQKLSSMCDRTNSSGQVFLHIITCSIFMGIFIGSRTRCTATATRGFFRILALHGRLPWWSGRIRARAQGETSTCSLSRTLFPMRRRSISRTSSLPATTQSSMSGVKEGDVVGIWGLGPIGQCAARFALMKGASRVIGIDNVRERLLMAESSGIEVINFSEHTDVVKRIQELVPGGLDVAIDCGTFHQPKTLLHKVEKTLMLETDVPEIVNEMIMATRKMGSCGIIAAYAGYTNHFNIGALMEKGIRLIGHGQAPVHKYWHDLLATIEAGKFDPTFVVTHRVSLDEFPALYASFDKRVAGVEKVFVETKFSAPPSVGTPKLSRVADWGLDIYTV